VTDCHDDGLAVQLRGDLELLRWPPRSPDLTPCDSFLWGYIKDRVFVPPLANTLVDLRAHITAAITEIDPNMLQSVWEELGYWLDVCRVRVERTLNICNASEKNLVSFPFHQY
jgi:hypothetical protein